MNRALSIATICFVSALSMPLFADDEKPNDDGNNPRAEAADAGGRRGERVQDNDRNTAGRDGDRGAGERRENAAAGRNGRPAAAAENRIDAGRSRRVETNLPLDDAPPKLDGIVLASDAKGTVEISIGSDDGLRKGNRAYVYRREQGERRPIAKIEIIEVGPDKSIGKVILHWAPIAKNDMVATSERAVDVGDTGGRGLAAARERFRAEINEDALGHVYQAIRFAGHGDAERLKQEDPEMFALLKADSAMENQTRQLVDQYHRAANDADREQIRGKLTALVENHFGVRQQRRELEVKRLEAQLDRLRNALKKRTEERQKLIDEHLNRLIGNDEAGF